MKKLSLDSLEKLGYKLKKLTWESLVDEISRNGMSAPCLDFIAVERADDETDDIAVSIYINVYDMDRNVYDFIVLQDVVYFGDMLGYVIEHGIVADNWTQAVADMLIDNNFLENFLYDYEYNYMVNDYVIQTKL